MSEPEHSILPPSSAARRIQCTASTTMEAKYPEAEESPDAAAGTASHWAGFEMLQGRSVSVGDKAPNGVFLDEEMIEGADLYVEDIARALAPHGMNPRVHGVAEQRVLIPRVHPQSWGTPDYRAWLPGAHLVVWDYKFGHRFVDVYENAQLVEYVAGLLVTCPIPNLVDSQIKVTVRIVQPRSFHRDGPIRSWTFRADEIRAHINIASNSAHEALGANAKARVGAECRDCKARHACPTLQRAAMTACDVAGAAQPFDLPVEAMALEYRTLRRYGDLLSARANGLEQQLLALGKAGKSTPGLRIEHGAGRERWTVTDEQVIQIGNALGVNVAKVPEAMTPKQAVKAGLPPAVLPGLTNSPRGEAKLVLDDGTLARKVFGS